MNVGIETEFRIGDIDFDVRDVFWNRRTRVYNSGVEYYKRSIVEYTSVGCDAEHA